MEQHRFAKAIYDKLFLPEGNRLVVAVNRDGYLATHDCCLALEELGVLVYSGDSLALRLVRELEIDRHPESRILFVMKDEFRIMDDIAVECDKVVFQFRSFFKHYSWDKVKQLSFAQMAWLYELNGIVDLDTLVNNYELHDVASEKNRGQIAYEDLLREWREISTDIDFNKPTEWMSKAGEIVLSILEIGKWSEFQAEVKTINDKFLEFLKTGYVNILASTCGNKYPKIVTQVLPFISKQGCKTALVVVDGMNWWQALLLTRSLEEKLNISAKYDCIYSWLPSVTELSRQAIFRGDIPSVDYVQGPQSEAKLWKEFWAKKGVASFEYYYQHSGSIDEETSVKRLGYVVTDLDDMMHSSSDYKYLLSNTKIWVEEEDIVGNIKHLIDGGYKVYITTDHGNVDASAYKKLDYRDALGANLSYRHITLPAEADKGIFEAEYAGHLVQVDKTSRTYYASEKEAFMNKGKCVTHGGSHWLEVLIPFITIL